jgi:hypothetical protein
MQLDEQAKCTSTNTQDIPRELVKKSIHPSRDTSPLWSIEEDLELKIIESELTTYA